MPRASDERPFLKNADAHAEIVDWLERFAACVRERRYGDARNLFAEEVVAFGTITRRMTGLAELERMQWRPIWETCSDFRFDMSELRAFESGELLVAAVPFHSAGYDDRSVPYPRPGRATLVLSRANGRLLAVHSHFSLDP